MSPTAITSGARCIACGGSQIDPCAVSSGYEIVACRSCGFRFVPPARLAQVNYDELYGDDGDYDYLRKEAVAVAAGQPKTVVRAQRLALAAIRRERPQRLLDVGCGLGGFLTLVEKMGIETWGLDLSAKAIELARGYLKAGLHCGVLSDDVFPGRMFDVITAWEVLEHVIDAAPFMRSIHERLNPGGRTFLSTPNSRSTWVWNDMADDPRSRPPVHVGFWNAAALKVFLERSGFEAVRVRQVSVHFPPSLWASGLAARARVALDAALRPAQRRTLFATATKPG